MKHMGPIYSLESKLFFISICSIRILNILEVIGKTSYSKIAKCSPLDKSGRAEFALVLSLATMHTDHVRVQVTW